MTTTARTVTRKITGTRKKQLVYFAAPFVSQTFESQSRAQTSSNTAKNRSTSGQQGLWGLQFAKHCRVPKMGRALGSRWARGCWDCTYGFRSVREGVWYGVGGCRTCQGEQKIPAGGILWQRLLQQFWG